MENTKEYRLAVELANTLNDRISLPAYVIFAQKYTEPFLREVLVKTLSVPEHKIRKTRGALFTHLVKQYAQSSNRPRS